MQTLVVGFDLDMTLVDSAAGIAATVQATLGEVGVTVIAEQVWAHNGAPLEDTMLALTRGQGQGVTQDVAALARRYRELYPELGAPVTKLLPGALDAVQAVRSRGGSVLVVSTKAEAAVRLVVERVGLGEEVDVIVGGLFAQAKGVRLRELAALVYVGDHPGDMTAARVARAAAVAVATGPHSAADLMAAGADVVLPDLTFFPAWLATELATGASFATGGRG